MPIFPGLIAGKSASAEAGASSWYQELTIDNTKVDGDLDDFVLYVDLSDLADTDDLFAHCTSDGGDLRVYREDGTQLPREIVAIDTTANTGEMHVRLTGTLWSDTDTVIRIYCDGTSTEPPVDSAYGRNAVWSDYAAVYHLNEAANTTAGGYVDSTGNGNDGTGVAMGETAVTGKLEGGLAQDFDGTADYVEHGANITTATAGTVSAWVKVDATGGNQEIFCAADTAAGNDYFAFQKNTSDYPEISVNVGGSYNTVRAGTVLSVDTWTHVVVQSNDTTWAFFRNGASDGATVVTGSNVGEWIGDVNGVDNATIGALHYTSVLQYWNGKIDEVRVTDVVLSANHIAAEYSNQNSPSTFYSVGTIATGAAGVAFGTWKYQTLTIDNTKVPGDLTDFVVYVDLSDLSLAGADIFDTVHSTGKDIRVFKEDGTRLPCEVVAIDTTAKTGELHFKYTGTLSSSADTLVRVYYNGVADAVAVDDTWGRNAVWSDYAGVYHMSEGTGDATDSTGNGYTLTATSLSATAAGKLSGDTDNADLDGSADHYTHADDAGLDLGAADFTVETWFYKDDSASPCTLISKASSNDGPSWAIDVAGDDKIIFYRSTGSGGYVQQDNATISTSTWYHLVVSCDYNTAIDIFKNGSEVTYGATFSNWATLDNTHSLTVGGYDESSRFLNGRIDELRIIKGSTRSSDYAAAAYSNQNSPSSFYSVSAEETSSGVAQEGASYQTITIDSSYVGSDLTDFVVYVDLADLNQAYADIFDTVQSAGQDIRVYKDDGVTQLPHEVVAIDTTAKTGELHFKYTGTLSSTSDTTVRIYFDGASSALAVTDTYGRNAVWSDYKAVYHLNEAVNTDSGGYADATGAYDATGTSMALTEVSGPLGKGQDFDGSADYITLPDLGISDGSTEFTMQCWVNPDIADTSSSSSYSIVVGYAVFQYDHTSGKPYQDSLIAYDGGWKTADLNTVINEWQLLHGVCASAATLAYRNGALVDTGSGGMPDTRATYFIGNNGGGFNGQIDEVRISEGSLSADWISAEYTNQNDTKTFYQVDSAKQWSKYQTLTIDATEVDADLTDFVIYVDLSDLSLAGADIFDTCQTDGGDIRVFKDDGVTELPREIVAIDTTAKTGEMHVKYTGTLSSTVDTVIRVYYNGLAEEPLLTAPHGRNAVWSDYNRVLHLKEAVNNDSGGYVDSTSNGNDGTGVSMSITAPVSKLGIGAEFAGDTGADRIETPAWTLGTSDFCISWWEYRESLASADSALCDSNSGNFEGLLFHSNATNRVMYMSANGSTWGIAEAKDCGAMALQTWELVTLRRSGSNFYFYVNGSQTATWSSASGLQASAGGVYIGARHDSTVASLPGRIDEFRAVVGDSLSADHIAAEYSNQNAPSSFYTVGAETTD